MRRVRLSSASILTYHGGVTARGGPMKLAIAGLAMLATPNAWAGKLISVAVPALDDVGLIVLAVLVGGVASWIARRRRR